MIRSQTFILFALVLMLGYGPVAMAQTTPPVDCTLSTNAAVYDCLPLSSPEKQAAISQGLNNVNPPLTDEQKQYFLSNASTVTSSNNVDAVIQVAGAAAGNASAMAAAMAGVNASASNLSSGSATASGTATGPSASGGVTATPGSAGAAVSGDAAAQASLQASISGSLTGTVLHAVVDQAVSALEDQFAGDPNSPINAQNKEAISTKMLQDLQDKVPDDVKDAINQVMSGKPIGYTLNPNDIQQIQDILNNKISANLSASAQASLSVTANASVTLNYGAVIQAAIQAVVSKVNTAINSAVQNAVNAGINKLMQNSMIAGIASVIGNPIGAAENLLIQKLLQNIPLTICPPDLSNCGNTIPSTLPVTGGGMVDNWYDDDSTQFQGAFTPRGGDSYLKLTFPSFFGNGAPHDAGVNGVQAGGKGIHHKNTANLSPILMNNHWLYKEMKISSAVGTPEDVKNKLYKHSDEDSVIHDAWLPGLGGDPTITNDYACVDPKPFCMNDDGTGPQPEEAYNRLRMDSCANQFILDADNQIQYFDPVSGDLPINNPNPIYNSAGAIGNYNEADCQPLNVTAVTCEMDDQQKKCVQKTTFDKKGAIHHKDKYDYEAWYYLAHAWRTLMSEGYYLNSERTETRMFAPEVGFAENWTNFGDGVKPMKMNLTPMGETGLDETNTYQAYSHTQDNGGNRQPVYDQGAPVYGNIDVQLNDLIPQPYERIIDPSHPYSPRWDYSGNERDKYSWRTVLAYAELGTCTVRCSNVPVDLMRFRSDRFDRCVNCRMGINTTAFWDEVGFNTTLNCAIKYACWLIPANVVPAFIDAYTNAIRAATDSVSGSAGGSINVSFDGWVSNESRRKRWPPCSTKFDLSDNRPDMCNSGCPASNVPGETGVCPAATTAHGKNDLRTPTERMGGNPGNQKNDSFTHACEFLAAPVAPMNILKLRNSQKIGREGQMPEGYEFKTFFDKHKPFMRWWDSGNESGAHFAAVAGTDSVDLKCTDGYYDTLIGVGSPTNYGSTQTLGGFGPSSGATTSADSCRYGGWGKGNSERKVSCTSQTDGTTTLVIPPVDAMGGWEELKLYQANSRHLRHLSCIGQYEKLFKEDSAEDKLLKAIALPYRGRNGEPAAWPQSWMGYVSAPDEKERFPQFGKDRKSAVLKGLDNAQVGDIIYLDEKYQDDPKNPRFPVLAVVTKTHTISGGTMDAQSKGKAGESIDVEEFNYGKYPDACGNTNAVGIKSERSIYKHNRMPDSVYQDIYYSTAGGSGNCQPVQLRDETGSVYFDSSSNPDTHCTIDGSRFCGEDVNMGHCQTPEEKAGDVNTNQGDLWNNYMIYRFCKEGNFAGCVKGAAAPAAAPAAPAAATP